MKYSIATVTAFIASATASLYGESDLNHTCILQPNYLSCSKQANPTTVDSCCVETYGGLVLQTQYWDINTGYEAEGQLLPAYSWTIHGKRPSNQPSTFFVSDSIPSHRLVARLLQWLLYAIL